MAARPGGGESAAREGAEAARRSAPSRVRLRQGQADSGGCDLADPQGEVTFEDVIVRFSPEEWSMLEGWQKVLHQEVMQDNWALLLSLGHPIPSGAFLSLIHQQEVSVEGRSPRKIPYGGGDDEECLFPEDVVEVEGPWNIEDMKDEDMGCLSPSRDQEGKYQSSLHLCALMKFVKEIPEFLYGPAAATAYPAAMAGGSEVQGEEEGLGADAKMEPPTENLHPCSPESDSAGGSRGPHSHSSTPSSSTEKVMGEPQLQGWGVQVKAAAAPERPSIHNGGEQAGEVGRPGPPEAPTGDSLPCSAAGDLGWKSAKLEAGEQLPKDTAEDLKHQALPGCRKEGATHDLDPPVTASESTSLSNGCTVKERRSPAPRSERAGCENAPGLSSPNNAQEKTVEEKPLQGLLKCLKDLIVHQPLPSFQATRKVPLDRSQEVPEHRREASSRSPPMQVKSEIPEKEPSVWGGSSPPVTPSSNASDIWTGEGRRARTPEREEGSPHAAVKTELTAGPPLQHLDQPGRSFSVHRAAEKERRATEIGGLCVKIKTEDDPPLEVLMGCLKEAPEEKRNEQAHLPNHSISPSGREPRLWLPYSEEWSPATSPLHGLLNCLREIPIPGPGPAKVLAGKTGGGGGGRERRKGGRRGPLDLCGDQTTPEHLCEVSSCSRTPPAATLLDPLAENLLPREPGAKQSPLPLLLSGVCLNNHLGQGAESRKPEAGPRTSQGCREGLSTPPQGLERRLKDLPLGVGSQPASPAVSSSVSSSPDRRSRWTPEPGKWVQKEEGLGRNSSPLQGLERCLKDLPSRGRSQPSSPALSSSLRGSLDQLHRWTSEAGKWARKEEGLSRHASPLPGLDNHPKALPRSMHRQVFLPTDSSSLGSSSKGPSRPEVGEWSAKEEGVSPPGIPPLQGLENCLKEIPVGGHSLQHCFTATSFSCPQKLRRVDAESRRPWAADAPKDSLLQRPRSVSDCMEAGVESSPLHRLMSCLKEVPIRRPSYLDTPSISSASSSCSELERDRQSPESGAWWDSSQDMPGGILVHSPQNSPQDTAARPASVSDAPTPDSFGSTSEGDVEQNHLDGQQHRPVAEAKRKATASNTCLQGLADYLVEMPANPCQRSKAPASNCQGSSEHREQDRPKNTTSLEEERLTESSPLQGLLRCLKEITARGPNPCGLSPSNSGAETRHLQAKEETGNGRAPREGSGSCTKERPSSRTSPASMPLSSPPRESVPGSPALEAGRGHRGVASISTPLCATGRCPGVSGTGSVLNGRSPSHSAQRQGDARPPKSGVKRSLLTVKGGAPQVPGAQSCTFSSGGSAESENPPKKRCPSLDQSPPLCSWGKADPRECQAEEGDLGPVLSQKLDRLSEDMSAICRDVSRLQSHMDRLERDARGWVLELAALRMENRCLSEYVRRMESRCRTLEGRSRRNNLRLLGLPEGAEGSDAVSFLQKMLPEMLGLQLDSLPLEIESARRVHGGASWDPNGRPRALLFRLLRFADKAAILQAARTRPLSYAGTQVTILPDFCSSPSQRGRFPFGSFRRTR